MRVRPRSAMTIGGRWPGSSPVSVSSELTVTVAAAPLVSATTELAPSLSILRAPTGLSPTLSTIRPDSPSSPGARPRTFRQSMSTTGPTAVEPSLRLMTGAEQPAALPSGADQMGQDGISPESWQKRCSFADDDLRVPENRPAGAPPPSGRVLMPIAFSSEPPFRDFHLANRFALRGMAIGKHCTSKSSARWLAGPRKGLEDIGRSVTAPVCYGRSDGHRAPPSG